MREPNWVQLALLVSVGLVLVVAVGWLATRILGVQRGFWRAAVAGVAGLWGAIALFDWEFSEVASASSALAVITLLGTALMLTMVLSIMLDALLPQRDPGRPRGARAAARRVRGYASSWGRALEIARHARARGLPVTQLSSPQGALALRETLEDAGGILVKFGQIASTRTDLLPPAVTGELAHLRSSVPGLPVEVVRARIEAELGAPIEQLFASFDPEPLAAASIGVTHRATLADGRAVVVKVQRPGIEETVERDARVLRWGARRLEARRAAFASLRVSALAEELIGSVRRELDFTVEQASNAAMRSSRAADPGMRFPEILPSMTTRRVLVMEHVDGRPVSDVAALEAAGRARSEMADNLLGSFLAQTLVDGVFHADPHPGNVLVDTAGDLWLIDYGAVGVVDPITLEGLQLLAAGFIQRDAGVMARAVRRMVGSQGTLLDIAAIETDMAAVLGQFGGSGFDPAVIAAVARSLARYDVAAPAALTVLARAGLTLDGTLEIMDPGFAMGQRAQPIVKELAADQVPADPRELLTGELLRSLPALRAMPQLTEDLALQVRAGRLTMRTERYAGDDRVVVDAWVDRVIYVAIGLVGVLTSAVLIVAAVLAEGTQVARYVYAVGFTGLVLSTAMLLRAVATVQSRDRRR
jgi:ubiquinone biosynthesis protein